MTFWILALLLMVAATLSLAVPLLRRPSSVTQTIEYDREVYRARLSEIESDLALGRIGAAEAEAAKAEEGRKLLAMSEAEPASTTVAASPALARAVAIVALLLVPPGAVLAYLASGQPAMPDMALADRSDRDAERQSVTQLVERAEAQLASNPDDVRGWSVLAPIYMRMGRFADAVTAWRNAVRLEPENADFRTSFGEAITAAASGVVTEEARTQFAKALEQRAGDPKARFYLALALGQEGSLTEAEAAWRGLIADSPADAPWIGAARGQLAEVLQRAGKPAEPEVAAGSPAAPGPTREDIAAASEMDDQSRQEMIESMVTRLADRMKDDPSDKAGWLRLIRAYDVLGKVDEAKAAIADARRHLAADASFVSELDGLEKGLGKGGIAQ